MTNDQILDCIEGLTKTISSMLESAMAQQKQIDLLQEQIFILKKIITPEPTIWQQLRAIMTDKAA